MPFDLKGIISSGLGELAEKIGSTVRTFVTTKGDVMKNDDVVKELDTKILEVTNAHIEIMADKAQKETEAYFADIDSARKMNQVIQDSAKGSWLSKNVAYFIDIFVFMIWGAMTIYITAKFLNIIKVEKGVDFSGILGIYSGVTAIAMTILNFHRGTSKGSQDNQAHMRLMDATRTEKNT